MLFNPLLFLSLSGWWLSGLVLGLNLPSPSPSSKSSSYLSSSSVEGLGRETKQEAINKARSIIAEGEQRAFLSTISILEEVKDFPTTSVEFVWESCLPDKAGEVQVALVSWGEHANNARANPSSSIHFISSPFNLPHHPEKGLLNETRFTILGDMIEGNDEEVERNFNCLVKNHPTCLEDWFFGHNFKFFSLAPKTVRYVGGYGDTKFIGYINPEEWTMDDQEGNIKVEGIVKNPPFVLFQGN